MNIETQIVGAHLRVRPPFLGRHVGLPLQIFACATILLLALLCYLFQHSYKLAVQKQHLIKNQQKMSTEIANIKQELQNFSPPKHLIQNSVSEYEQTILLNSINTALESGDAILTSLQPNRDSWQIDIAGNYQDFWRFLEILNNSNSASFAILHLKISSTENSPNTVLLMQLEANYQAYKQTETAPSEAPPQGQFLPDPFRKSPNKEIPDQETALSTWPISCLNLTGTLLKNQLTLAILSDPNGNIYSMRPGNKIGQEKKAIQTIQFDKITLNDKQEISITSP